MDAYHTFNSCFWPMEEDVASKNAFMGSYWTKEEEMSFENALANYFNNSDIWDKLALAVPGKTIEDLKIHYDALIDKMGTIESCKVPFPSYPSKVGVNEARLPPKQKEQARGTPWTEEEHRQFLYGLQRFGRGNWKSISRYSVRTRSNSQVASHAQKYFKRLNSTNEGKRLSINDIRTVNPEKLLALEKATTSCMSGCCKEKSTGAGRTEELLPRCLEKGSTHVKNPLLPQGTAEVSMDAEFHHLLPELPNKSSADARKQLMPRRSKRALTVDGNRQLPRYIPNEAPTTAGKRLLLGFCGFPMKAPTDMGNQLQSGYSTRERNNTGFQLLPPPPFTGLSASSSFYSQAIKTDIWNQPNNSGNQFLAPFSGQATGGPSFTTPACNIPSPPFASMPIQGRWPSVKERSSLPTDALMEDADAPVAGQFDFGSSTDIVDLDLSMFPHFLD